MSDEKQPFTPPYRPIWLTLEDAQKPFDQLVEEIRMGWLTCAGNSMIFKSFIPHGKIGLIARKGL